MTTLDDIYSITTEEAFSFLTGVLCISKPKVRMRESRLAFVEEILRAMYRHIPWQTIGSLSTPHHVRHLPTLEEIKEDVSTKIGGRCYALNVYGFMLLTAIGYDVSLVPATVHNNVDCHTALIAYNLSSQNSKHVVDFGAGSPSFRPIPLTFKEMSPEYADSFLRSLQVCTPRRYHRPPTSRRYGSRKRKRFQRLYT